ncbi:unnamed protein product [Dicrocoelium dendriticum]|nr:unnamed protein product [Dicrocoelium dendriticum]
MNITRSFSLRRKKKKPELTDGSKPKQWLDDEAKIKEGCCSFQVKYLGNIEVYESRGMQVCEEAIKALRKSKKKPQKAILYVSGDALRVSDDVSQHLMVDQTIEKVSFCAPDRSHDKGFAYICRDGASRRWICHAFLAVKESGERLSHAVGCAFAICLEKKQKRERDALQLAASEDRTFARVGSFRPASLAERLIDPQSAIVTDPVSPRDTDSCSTITPAKPMLPQNPSLFSSTRNTIVPRPRPSPSILERQGSLRVFPKLQDACPFKRDLSVRLDELPSTLQRLTCSTSGDAIPEETGQELEECPPEPKLELPGSHPSLFSTSFLPSSTLDSVPNASVSSGSLAQKPHPTAQTVSSSVHIVPQPATAPSSDCSASFIDDSSDPFSAAPFSREIVQSHYPVQTAPVSPPITSVIAPELVIRTKPTGDTSVFTAPTSPFLGGPPIVAPTSTSHIAAWPSTAHPGWPYSSPMSPYASFPSGSVHLPLNAAFSSPQFSPLAAFPHTGLPGNSNTLPNPSWLPSADSTSNWQTPFPSLLPPEPDRLSDPFDIGWADRATCGVGVPTVRKPGNPFVQNHSGFSDVNGATGDVEETSPPMSKPILS